MTASKVRSVDQRMRLGMRCQLSANNRSAGRFAGNLFPRVRLGTSNEQSVPDTSDGAKADRTPGRTTLRSCQASRQPRPTQPGYRRTEPLRVHYHRMVRLDPHEHSVSDCYAKPASGPKVDYEPVRVPCLPQPKRPLTPGYSLPRLFHASWRRSGATSRWNRWNCIRPKNPGSSAKGLIARGIA